MTYPEAEKVMEVHEKSQRMGSFLEWLQSNGRVLCRWHDKTYYNSEGDLVDEYVRGGLVEPEGYHPTRETIEELLAEYFDIDLKKYHAEREEMMATIRGTV